MSERKIEDKGVNGKRGFVQKILGFRFTPSISAWKLAIALFLLIAIAYAVNGAGVIAKGNNLEVSGNATVQGKVGIGTTAPDFLLNVVSSGTALPVEISASSSGTGHSFGLLRLWRLNNAVNDEAGIIFSLQDTQPARQEYGYVAAKISASTSGSEAGNLLFSTTDAGVTRQERMRITSAGNVGIGTTSPASKLDVAGSVEADGFTINGTPLGTSTDSFWSASGGNIYYNSGNVGIGTLTPGSELHVQGQLKVDSTINDKLVLAGTQAAPHTIFLDNSKGIRFWDNVNGELMRITNTGNVGIGTTGPTRPLDVTGAAPQLRVSNAINPNAWNAEIVFSDLGVGGSGAKEYKIGLDTNDYFFVRDMTAASTPHRLVIDTAGNVGIGTTDPASILHLKQSEPVLTLEATRANDPRTWKMIASYEGAAGTVLRFHDVTSDATRLTIDKNGNVGIGTTGPTSTLSVAGRPAGKHVFYVDRTTGDGSTLTAAFDSHSSNPSTDVELFSNGVNKARWGYANSAGSGITGSNAGDVVFVSQAGGIAWGANGDNAVDMYLSSSGNLGIGTPGPARRLQVANGNIYVSDAGEGTIVKSPDGATCARIGIDNGANIIRIVVACP